MSKLKYFQDILKSAKKVVSDDNISNNFNDELVDNHTEFVKYICSCDVSEMRDIKLLTNEFGTLFRAINTNCINKGKRDTSKALKRRLELRENDTKSNFAISIERIEALDLEITPCNLVKNSSLSKSTVYNPRWRKEFSY